MYPGKVNHKTPLFPRGKKLVGALENVGVRIPTRTTTAAAVNFTISSVVADLTNNRASISCFRGGACSGTGRNISSITMCNGRWTILPV